MKKIEKLRKQLHEAIESSSGNLLNPEVIEISQRLDKEMAKEQRCRLNEITDQGKGARTTELHTA